MQRARVLQSTGYNVTLPLNQFETRLYLSFEHFQMALLSPSLGETSANELLHEFRCFNPGSPVVGLVKAEWEKPVAEVDRVAVESLGPQELLNVIESCVSPLTAKSQTNAA